MVSERISEGLRQCRSAGRSPILPYFTSGFPDGETAAELVTAALRVGVPGVEIGIPYSDSIADGPVIQESFNHALQHGHRVAGAFDLLRRVRPDTDCGLILMLSYTLMHRMGAGRFVGEAASAGADGVILPDVPQEESDQVRAAVHDAGLCYIGLVAPTSTPERRREIARSSSGFLYQIAATGTTGERADIPRTLGEDVAELRIHTALPVCVGFGISSAAQVREVCKVADGAIVGSALIRRVAQAVSQGRARCEVVAAARTFLEELSVA